MSLSIWKKLAFLATLVFFGNVHAFQFEFLFIKDPVHQDMAEKALKCVALHPDANEINCESIDVSAAPEYINLDINGMTTLSVADIRESVVWADDPVRELRKRKLHKSLLWVFRLLANECKDLRDGLKDGLRCSTHYGPLQFMHAMESVEQRPAKDTQKTILDWIEYSYKVAVNTADATGYFNDKDYCSHFEMQEDSAFKNAMFPQDASGNALFPCNQHDDTPWQLGTVFSFSCWFGSVVCSEYSFGNNYVARKAALGAILHAIQDSYSKGHTSRGGDSEEAINRYECSAIDQFQLYTEQNHDKHTEADTAPKDVSAVCFLENEDIHGPIRASAEIIRLFKQGEAADKVVSYLSKHVFLLTNDAKKSGSTELFKM
ncbi:hypothetical protein [Paraglaciecola sp.]|uniref:hypothetical protein n=1 Tax=Paraglaciecola sp. TaxID=1920173 RepID=UPI0030F3FEEE